MEDAQLRKLAKRVAPRLVGSNGRGMDAMDHSVATQLLLLIVGPYDFEVKEVLRSKTKKGGPDAVVTGVIGRLTCEIDGRRVSVEEAGGVENADNDDGDGERLKKATSDAIKRCAMRMGLGLHLWADGGKNNHYFLDEALEKRAKEAGSPPGSARTDVPKPAPPGTPNDRPRNLPEEGTSDIVELGRKRDELLALIEERGRDLARFENMVGGVDEIDEETLDHWLGKLRMDGMKGAAAGSPRG